MYKKRYNLREIIEIFEEQIKKGRKYMDIESLLFEIFYDPLDINMFWVKNVKFRVRYDREVF